MALLRKNAPALLGAMLVFWAMAHHPVLAGVPQVKAQTAVLMDAVTGEILFDKEMHTRKAPASTTKIMTAILAIESGRLDETATVSVKAASTPGSSMHLYAGQKITLRELLAGLLLRSGNDAAIAIAEHLAGTADSFAAAMNQKAAAIGIANTRFRNPHGLTAPGHYSSAYDLAWLARYALANPVFAEIVSTKETNIEWLDRRGKEKDVNLRNTNKLLWMLEDADGVKTGTTGAAGPCLVSSATRGNHKLIAVVLHDHSRWYDSMQLLKYGFDNYELYEYAAQGDVMANMPVEGGAEASVDVLADAPAALVVKAADYGSVAVEVDLPEKIKAPVYQGQKVGEIVFYIGGTAIKSVDITAARDIPERTAAKAFLKILLSTFRHLAGWGIL